MSDLIADMQNMVSELIAGAQGPLIAELAALKARRCETCKHWAGHNYCQEGVGEEADVPELPLPDFSCNRWAEGCET